MKLRFAPTWRRVGPVYLALAATCVADGCSTTRARPEWVQTAMFWEPKEQDERYVKKTPAEEIDELRAEMATIPTLPPEQQQAKAGELAQRFQNEADPLIRIELVRTVARCGSPTAAEVLRSAATDSDRDVRIAVCQAWAVHGGPQAVPQLSEALRKDASVDVRLAAAKALGQLGGDEAVMALSTALDDQDPALQYRTVQSLREITGKDFGDNVAAWRDYTKGTGAPPEISLVERMKLKAF